MDTVELITELVRVPSINPSGHGERQVAEILRGRLDRAGCYTRIVTSSAGRPSLVARLPGPTERPALVLLSHSDVVPVEEAAWRRDPFGGEVADGELWGRGTLDMKGIAVLHAQAVEDLAGAADGAQAVLFRLLASAAGPAAIRMLAPLLHTRANLLGHLLSDSMTPTCLQAGYKFNVVPGEAEATFDGRLLPDTDPDELLAWLHGVAARHGVEIDELHRWHSPGSPRSGLFGLLAEVSTQLPSRPVPVPSLTPAVTHLRFFRARGAIAYGWVPLVLTPELVATIHGNNERVPLDELHRAQDAITEVVRRACS